MENKAKEPQNPQNKKPDSKVVSQESKGPNHRLIYSIALIGTVVVAGLLWMWTRAPLVPAVQVSWAPLIRTLHFSARVNAAARVEVASTTTGRVVAVFVVAGQTVKKGEPLFQLDSSELLASFGQAKANEGQAAARLLGVQTTGQSFADSLERQADAISRRTQNELARTRELAASGFLSPAKLDEAVSAAQMTEAQRSGARAQSAASRTTEVTQARALLAVAKAASAVADAKLAQQIVFAPTDAVVLTRDLELGQIVQPAKPLLLLALAGPTILSALVDERFLAQLGINQTAVVFADAYPLERFRARIQFIAPIVDLQRGVVLVKLAMDEKFTDHLREDMTLSVEVETARRDKALVVPLSALQIEEPSNRARLFVVVNGRAIARQVALGIKTLEYAEVIEGLTDGEVVLNSTKLRANERVRPQLTTPALAP